MVKNIPAVQNLFFELVRKQLSDIEIEEQMPSISLGELVVQSVHTQIGNTNAMFSQLEDYKVVSVIISDDRLDEHNPINNSERNARYDGVIFADPGWLIIIENKPLRHHIWLDQLNPSLNEEAHIIHKPCALSWRDLIERLNMLVINGILKGLELQLVEDFLEFVDQEFSYINPYTQFGVCKGNSYLLDKRCVDLLNQLIIDGEKAEVNYHRGWTHYANSNRKSVKQIALDAQVDGDDWKITLYLYAADTMSSAKYTYSQLQQEAFMKLKEQGFSLWSNFHISFRSSNLFWSDGQMTLESYIDYWLKNAASLKQIKREQFEEEFLAFEEAGLTTVEDRDSIKEKLLDKSYQTLNICPGIGIAYTWSSKDAIELDKHQQFLPDLKQKIRLAFAALGDDINVI
ncbi:hypothetical protein [Kurthia massiliensis]|uniref:hypothetical protein n=1 Tax=Kurthia massiliensis TaxID=1033739 RepID=UPI000288248C|nr:hypothetical protein [Kurthia massiliensis]